LSSAKDYDILKHKSNSSKYDYEINNPEIIYSAAKYDSKTDDLKSVQRIGTERPGAMRQDAVNKYIALVSAQEQYEEKKEIIKKMYLMNIDNRILNNLRKQLNEMIEDETGLIPVEEFRKLFFTYFKGSQDEIKVFHELLPSLTV